jgi:hypothetical protein
VPIIRIKALVNSPFSLRDRGRIFALDASGIVMLTARTSGCADVVAQLANKIAGIAAEQTAKFARPRQFHLVIRDDTARSAAHYKNAIRQEDRLPQIKGD